MLAENLSGLQGSFDTIQDHLGQEEAFKARLRGARVGWDETNEMNWQPEKYISEKSNGWLDEILQYFNGWLVGWMKINGRVGMFHPLFWDFCYFYRCSLLC